MIDSRRTSVVVCAVDDPAKGGISRRRPFERRLRSDT
jgi:hypothetical protein